MNKLVKHKGLLSDLVDLYTQDIAIDDFFLQNLTKVIKEASFDVAFECCYKGHYFFAAGIVREVYFISTPTLTFRLLSNDCIAIDVVIDCILELEELTENQKQDLENWKKEIDEKTN